MVVTESLVPVDLLVETVWTEGGVFRGHWDHKAHLGPAVGESATSAGAEPPAQTHRDLN